MANYNPQEEQSLLDLLSGLQGGMTGGQGYALLGDIMGQQQSRVAERQAQLGALADLLTQGAMGGQTYGAASSVADAMTPQAGIPGGVEQMLGGLYPNATPPTNASGAVMDFPSGSRPGTPYGPPGSVAPTYGAQSTSPAFQPAPMSPTESIAFDKYNQELLIQQDFAAMSADAAAATQPTALDPNGQPWTPQTFMAMVAQKNPQLMASDPGMVAEIVARAFGVNPAMIGA